MFDQFTPFVYVVAVFSGSAGLWLTARQFIRHRTERQRWASVERMTETHGLAVLDKLPQLVSVLRDGKPDTDPPADTPLRRARRKIVG